MAEATSWLALYGLTEADLEANRQGRITETQAARVRKEAASRKKFILAGMMFGAAGACGALAIQAARAQDLVLAIPVTVGVSLLVGLLVFKFVNSKFEKELTAGAVTPVEGTLDKLHLVPFRGGFFCTVGGTGYQAVQATELGKVLKVGDPVRLFVLPKSRQVVAIERR